MNGALRTALLFYVRSRAQRRFFALAVLSFAARLVMLRMPCGCNRATSLWYFLSLLPAIGFASVSLMSGAGAFRMLSSLRTVYLIPRSRAQLVFALLLAQVLVATLVTLMVVALDASASVSPAWGSPRGTFEYALAIATLAVVALQVIAGPSRVASVLSGALLLGLLARPDLFLRPEIAGVPTADLLTLAALTAWAAFATWYLRTGPIAPVAAVWGGWPHRAGDRSPLTAASRAAAIDAYLLGQPSIWLACRRQLFFWVMYASMFATVLGLRPFIFEHVRHPPPPDFSSVPMLLLLAISAVSNTIAGGITRHSRALWLRSGESRGALFASAERLAWRALALVGFPLFLAATVTWNVLPHLQFEAAFPVAVYLTLAPCGVYCGLLNFTRNKDLRFLAFFLIVSQSGIVAAVWQSNTLGLPDGGVPLVYWALPLALAVFALALRRVAERRWLTIDWLRYRAERTGAMGLRV